MSYMYWLFPIQGQTVHESYIVLYKGNLSMSHTLSCTRAICPWVLHCPVQGQTVHESYIVLYKGKLSMSHTLSYTRANCPWVLHCPTVTRNDHMPTNDSYVTHTSQTTGGMFITYTPPHVQSFVFSREWFILVRCNCLSGLNCDSNWRVGHAFSFKRNFTRTPIYWCSHCLCYHSN